MPGANPIGALISYAGATDVDDHTGTYMVADGRAISRTTYAVAFARLGTAFGVGDGSTTFNLPNLKGRVPVGRDSGQTEFDSLGETGGAKTHTLTVAQLPPHQHLIPAAGGPAGGTAFDHNVQEDVGAAQQTKNNGFGNPMQSQPHNNLQPYQVLNWLIRVL